ncbi:hypothetical protein AB0H00_31350 [Nocardia sp. NPDC023852]|uniref:EF-hand domain-containing protein n=1 Tax=Nocardia sp. NPDC023852 TaxID=3154697 RepID=UPI0033C9BC19
MNDFLAPGTGFTATVAAEMDAAAAIAAEQHPLLRRKQLRMFAVADVDGDGVVTPADTAVLARRLAQLTGYDDSSPRVAQLSAAIDQVWHAFVVKPRWVPDLERLDREHFVIAMANSVATTPDKTLQYIGNLTNLAFAMIDADNDGLIDRDDAIRLGTTILGFSPADAETAWAAIDPDNSGKLNYAQCLTAVTEYVTSVDAATPANLLLGPF